MSSEGLREMFEGDSADTCAGKFLLSSMGAERRVSRAQTREREPHRCERKLKKKINKFHVYFLRTETTTNIHTTLNNGNIIQFYLKAKLAIFNPNPALGLSSEGSTAMSSSAAILSSAARSSSAAILSSAARSSSAAMSSSAARSSYP